MTPTPSYRKILLTQGQFALVDAIDYPYLSQFHWHAWWNKNTQSFYAVRKASIRGGRQPETIYMHREVLGLRKGDRRQGEHIFHRTLDNRRRKLRIATNRQNHQNARKKGGSGVPLKGVYFHRKRGKFYAQIKHEKVRYLGSFDTAREAAQSYDRAAREFFGEFALTNYDKDGTSNAA